MFVGAKCRSADRQCFSIGISRIQRLCYASILPPHAPPVLGRSLSVSQAVGRAASLAYSAPLLGKPTAWSYPAAIPPHLCRGKPRQKCSGQPGGSRSGCWRRQSPVKLALDCAGGSVQGSICCRECRTAIRASGPFRPRPGRPSASSTMPVFVGVWEPKVSQPLSRQSPPTPSRQTASPASLRFAPAPWSLGDSKPGFPHRRQHHIDRRHPPGRPVLETPSNQGLPWVSRPGRSAYSSALPRSEDGKRVYIFTQGSSGFRRCGCDG